MTTLSATSTTDHDPTSRPPFRDVEMLLIDRMAAAGWQYRRTEQNVTTDVLTISFQLPDTVLTDPHAMSRLTIRITGRDMRIASSSLRAANALVEWLAVSAGA